MSLRARMCVSLRVPMGGHAHARGVSTAAAGPLPGGHRFTVVEAAAASGVSRRTIQRALPQLIEHGAERVGAAWSIPYAALVAAGFRPGQVGAPPARNGAQRTVQESDRHLRASSALLGAPLGSRLLDPTELTVELLTVRVQLEAAQQRAADLTRQLDRAYAEADAWRVMATHQLHQAPTPTPSAPSAGADSEVSTAVPAVETADGPVDPSTDPSTGLPAGSTTAGSGGPGHRWWRRRRG